jgi:hypothetical protein
MEQNNNTSLPAEVQNEITIKAEEVYNRLDGLAREQDSYDFGLPMFNKVKEPIETALTEYATKLHMAQRVIEKVDTKLLSAIDLLREVFQKHESGMLPDRFVYDKIKEFLYGE